MKIKITERGWPGHFCGSSDCVFRRNTLITVGKRIGVIVSTVGQYKPNGKPEMIGYRRWYETFVFVADMDDPYRDPIDLLEIRSDGICADTYKELGEYVDNDANEMHERMVKQISKDLENGWKPEVSK